MIESRDLLCPTPTHQFLLQKPGHVYLTFGRGTTIPLSDSRIQIASEDADAVIFSKSDLTINGSGTLSVTLREQRYQGPMTLSISQVEPSHGCGRCLQRQWQLSITGTLLTIDADEVQSRRIMMKILRSRQYCLSDGAKWPSLRETMESMLLVIFDHR